MQMGPDCGCCPSGSISSSPTWSPDGDSLLYSAVTPAVFRMAADGSNRRRISRGSAPSFAPDGRHFAYVRNRPGPGTAIRRARLDGTHDRSLGVGDMPRWSPAGRKLAYYRHGVWIMSSRTGKQPRLVATRDFMPLDWSPDGQRLLCASFDPRNARADLYVVRVDGSRPPRQLTRTADRSEEQAAWSPNGRRIVVAATTSPKPFSLQYSILTMSRRGQDEQRIWSSRVFGDEDEDWAGSQPTVSWQPRPQ